ncbi:MAG: SDR family NAD(P)-dependent oxidoreductase, partial [Gammaproteobacteria bacterium]|nr:SDR family NAD(P)-dependent oxidoreductase [Gammaproteobacteria bacterium]
SMMERRSGHIVTLTSPAGYVPFPNMMPYVAARHAMNGLALSLNEELKPYGVGSTLFCPAQVNTGYFDRNDADMDWYPKASKIFPVLEPDEVGVQVIKAIRKNKREMIYPWSLRWFVRFYQKLPGLSVGLLRVLGLWRPAVTQHAEKVTAQSQP